MNLYNHAAIWEDPKMMPRSFFCNGYIMVDGEKMSKHLGNFYTMNEIVTMFGADSTRLTFASAGDLLEDANIEIESIDKAILKIFILQNWIEKQLATLPEGSLAQEDPNSLDIFDKFFLNDMVELVDLTRAGYDSMRFRDVVKYGFYEFQGIKDDYIVCKKNGKISWRAILRYVEWQLIIMAPIIPHMADYCWRMILLPKLKEIGEDKDKSPTVVDARYPDTKNMYDTVLGRIGSYLKYVKRKMRLKIEKETSGKKGKNKGGKEIKKESPPEKTEDKKQKKVDDKKEEGSTEGQKDDKASKKGKKEAKKEKKEKPKFSKCLIFVTRTYNEMQRKVLEVITAMPLDENNEPQGDIVAELRKVFDKDTIESAIEFGNNCAERAKEIGKKAFEIAMPFDEKELILKHSDFLVMDMQVEAIEVFDITDECPYEQFKNSKNKANPGNPEIYIIP
jgi:leucyl-tRNA synthetase